jgi:hypothetical protein
MDGTLSWKEIHISITLTAKHEGDAPNLLGYLMLTPVHEYRQAPKIGEPIPRGGSLVQSDWFILCCMNPCETNPTPHLSQTEKATYFHLPPLTSSNPLLSIKPTRSEITMDIIKLLTSCCLSVNHNELIDEHTDPATEKLVAYTDFPSATELQSAAKRTSDKFLHLIFTAKAFNTSTINLQMHEIISSSQPITIASSWWIHLVLERLYKSMIKLITEIDQLRQKLSPALRKVVDEAEHFTHGLKEFQGEHPILAVLIETTVLALLIALLAPVLLEALGFGAEGVLEGEHRVIFIVLLMTSLTDDEQAVSPPDSSPCTPMFPMDPCSRSCRVLLQDTERV